MAGRCTQTPSLPGIIHLPLLGGTLLLFQDFPAEHLAHGVLIVSPPGPGALCDNGGGLHKTIIGRFHKALTMHLALC